MQEILTDNKILEAISIRKKPPNMNKTAFSTCMNILNIFNNYQTNKSTSY